jgi:hypothetical protein
MIFDEDNLNVKDIEISQKLSEYLFCKSEMKRDKVEQPDFPVIEYKENDVK